MLYTILRYTIYYTIPAMATACPQCTSTCWGYTEVMTP